MRLAVFSLALSLAALGTACSSIDPDATSHIKGPAFGDDGDAFRPVSAVIERRCGTLDCHGAPARPLRIYGQYSLRKPVDEPDADYYPGGLAPTSAEELLDNYRSMVGLEPEIMVGVVKGDQEPEELTLVRKPRLLEKHKGGLVWNKGDDGDACLINWITGKGDTVPCDTELLHR
jgi:hypothetical protein